jgi:hypothetical protein
VWLVDPALHLIEVFSPSPDGLPVLTLSADEDDVLVLPPFEGEIDVGAWWLPQAPKPGPLP